MTDGDIERAAHAQGAIKTPKSIRRKVNIIIAILTDCLMKKSTFSSKAMS
jgi:hypothetical protein